MNLVQWKMDTDIGELYLVASSRGLRGVYWKKQQLPVLNSFKSQEPEIKIIAKTAQELREYLDGEREKFSVPLDIQGTVFQMRVWKELAKIPYRKTRSYKEIASQIKNEFAIRAVGTANGKNPLSIIIPCHRV